MAMTSLTRWATEATASLASMVSVRVFIGSVAPRAGTGARTDATHGAGRAVFARRRARGAAEEEHFVRVRRRICAGAQLDPPPQRADARPMATPKKKPKIQASDVEVNNRTLEAVLVDLAEQAKANDARSARAEERSAR